MIFNDEHEFQKAVNKDLKDLGIMNYHRKSNGGGKQVTANRFKHGDKILAWPDTIIYLPKGRTIYLELKHGKNKLSEFQANFATFAMDNGYPFYTAWTWIGWCDIKKYEDII